MMEARAEQQRITSQAATLTRQMGSTYFGAATTQQSSGKFAVPQISSRPMKDRRVIHIGKRTQTNPGSPLPPRPGSLLDLDQFTILDAIVSDCFQCEVTQTIWIAFSSLREVDNALGGEKCARVLTVGNIQCFQSLLIGDDENLHILRCERAYSIPRSHKLFSAAALGDFARYKFMWDEI